MRAFLIITFSSIFLLGCSGEISGEFLDEGSAAPEATPPPSSIIIHPGTKVDARISFGQANPTSGTKSMRVDTNNHLEESTSATKSMRVSFGKTTAVR